MMSNPNPVILKATLDGTTRRLPFQGPPTLASLRSILSAHFTISPEAHITYKDEDGDDITFSTDTEFSDLLKSASSSNNILRVTIVTESATALPAPRQLDSLITNLSELVTVIRGTPAQPPAKRPCLRTQKIDRVAPKQGLFSGIRPLFSAFPQRRGLRGSVKAIDQETKTLFKTTATAIKKSPQRKALLAVLKSATPALRELIADLPDEGLPSVERVQVFVTAVETCTRGIDDSVMTNISEFIMKAACDLALIDCLRKVKDAPLMPWESGFVKSFASPRGFDIHQVTCTGCKKSPIVGTRYECAAEGNSLCSDCHTGDSLTQGYVFVKRKYVWEKNYEGLKVPPAPIKIGDRGVRVKFLHKVLTDLGFMNSGMYARRPGSFSENTKKAVAAFQAENNVAGETGIYDQVTADHLKLVVDERNMQDTNENTVGTDIAMEV